MKIPKEAIVSNSDIIKNYKTHRDRAEQTGKLFIFKKNQPDAVLYSISEYERFAELLEAVEAMNDEELSQILSIVMSEKKKMLQPF